MSVIMNLIEDPNHMFSFEEIQNWKEIGGVKLTIEDFKSLVESGIYDRNNGVGYYANDEKVSLVKVNFDDLFLPDPVPDENGSYPLPIVIRERMDGGTHVVWFNK